MKRLFPLLIIFPLLVGAPAPLDRPQFVPVRIVAVPDALTLARGELADVEIWLDSGGQPVDAAQVFVQFDPASVYIVSVYGHNDGLYFAHGGYDVATGVVSILSAGEAWKSHPDLGGSVPPFRLATVRIGAIADMAGAPVQIVRREPLMATGMWFRGETLCDVPPYPPTGRGNCRHAREEDADAPTHPLYRTGDAGNPHGRPGPDGLALARGVPLLWHQPSLWPLDPPPVQDCPYPSLRLVWPGRGVAER